MLSVFLALVVGKMRGRTKEHFMSGVRYSARLLVRKRSLCIGGQGHVQVVFFLAAAVSHNPLKPGTKSRRANKVSVHTQNSGSSSSHSHSQYRPTTLLGAAWRSSLCLPLLLRLAGRQTLAVFLPEILGISWWRYKLWKRMRWIDLIRVEQFLNALMNLCL